MGGNVLKWLYVLYLLSEINVAHIFLLNEGLEKHGKIIIILGKGFKKEISYLKTCEMRVTL